MRVKNTTIVLQEDEYLIAGGSNQAKLIQVLYNGEPVYATGVIVRVLPQKVNK